MSKIDWQWKYKIFFDRRVKAEISDLAKSIDNPERESILEQMEFYSSFYSLESLLDILSEKQDCTNSSEIVKHAVTNISRCKHTDQRLSKNILDRIEKIKDEYLKDSLKYILEYSLNTNFDVTFSDYLQIVCTDTQIREVKKKIEEESGNSPHPNLIRNHVNQGDMREEYNRVISDVTKNTDIIERYGDFRVCDYDIIVKKGPGYGEWWNHRLYDKYNRDTLVLFDNGNCSMEDFIYTIYHEVYPGHAHFFSKLEDVPFFDTGANMLIEGYATYVETHSILSDYSRSLERKYADCIKHVLCNQSSLLSDGVLLMVNQSVGFIESYYWGSFLLEVLIEQEFGTPKKYLDFLSRKRAVGDFFKLW